MCKKEKWKNNWHSIGQCPEKKTEKHYLYSIGQCPKNKKIKKICIQ